MLHISSVSSLVKCRHGYLDIQGEEIRSLPCTAANNHLDLLISHKCETTAWTLDFSLPSTAAVLAIARLDNGHDALNCYCSVWRIKITNQIKDQLWHILCVLHSVNSTMWSDVVMQGDMLRTFNIRMLSWMGFEFLAWKLWNVVLVLWKFGTADATLSCKYWW